MNITKITVIKTSKAAKYGSVIVETDLIRATSPFTGPLSMTFEATDAIKYCVDNFPGIDINVIYTKGN